MDWNLAIERNHAALKRIVAMLAAMAEMGNGQSAIGSRHSGEAGLSAAWAGPDPDCPLPIADCRSFADCRLTLPRHLHRAILRLLRPAESAVRRLVIVMARGLVVTLAPPRPRKAKPASIFLSKPGGTGIILPRGFQTPTASMAGAPVPRHPLTLPLFDPIGRPFRLRRPVASGVPRISLPGLAAPFPVAPRRPPAPNDPLDATRLALRLAALGAALDDLPRQARRFARWRARKQAGRAAGRIRRVWPLRPGRPPGQRPANRRTHEVYEILHDLHGLAFDVLESPDTS